MANEAVRDIFERLLGVALNTEEGKVIWRERFLRDVEPHDD